MKSIIEIRKEINSIDKEISDLFQKRMKLVKDIIEYKIKYSLPIYDPIREKEVIDINLENIKDEEIKKYYKIFLEELMNISKNYQDEILKK